LKNKNSKTTNTTLLRLKGTPFKTAAELKLSEEKILREEWESIQRARIRQELIQKNENQNIVAPLMNGFQAKFAADNGETENIVKVYLTANHSIAIDVDERFKKSEPPVILETLVKSLVDGVTSGYLATLGLRGDSVMPKTPKLFSKK
jgi:hypothetical protein